MAEPEDGASRRCVFCGAQGKLSPEHAVPCWAEKAIPGEGDFTSRSATMAGETRWEKTAPVLDQTVRRVCNACNTGWMHRLEDACIPLLRPAIRLEGHVTLDPASQRTVATWITKTAMMIEFVHGGKRIPDEHYRYVFDHRKPPPGAFVWLAAYTMQPYHAWSEPRELILQGSTSGTVRHGYVATFSIGHLVCQLSHFGSGDNVELERLPGFQEPVIQVWPITGDQSWPPLDTALDQSALEWLARNRFLSTA